MSAPATKTSLPSIQRYLLARIAGIVLFSFVVLAASVYFVVVRPAQEELARAEMERAADRVEGEIRALIEQIERVLATAREWGVSGLLRIDSPQDFAAMMAPVIKIRPHITGALLATERGQMIYFGRAGDGWVARTMDPALLGRQQHWIHLSADVGYVREEWVERDFDPRNRPWFKGGLALEDEKQAHWTEPYQFFEGKEPGITATMRWRDRNTGQRHLIAFDISLLGLSRFTSQVTVGELGRTTVLTADGRLLGLPRHPPLKSDADYTARLLKTPREAGLMMIASAHDGWIADGKPEARTSSFDVEGETWLGRFRTYRLRNQQLLIGTVAPRSQFSIGSRWDAAGIGVIMLLVLLLACFIGLRVARRFAGTIDRHTGELKEREAFTRALMDSSTSGLVLSQTDGKVRHVSARWTEITGYALEELAAIPADRLYAEPEVRERFLEMLRRDGWVRNFEARFVRKDGSEFWGLLNSSTVNVGGEALIASWVQDVTELREMTERIRALAEEQELLISNAQVGIVVSAGGTIVSANPRLLEITGHESESELAGKPASTLFPSEEDYAKFGAAVGPSLGAGKSIDVEWQLARRDGALLWVRITGKGIRAAAGDYRTVWMLQDISRRKAAEAALREANAEQSAIFESATSGIALIRDRVILRCNRKLEEIFGYAPGEFPGKPTRVWYTSDEEHARGGAAVYEQLVRGETHRREQLMRRKDGSTFWCRLTGRAVNTADASQGTVWMLEDVTEEHAAAEALRTANERLDLAQAASNIGVWDVVIGGRNIWTPQLERMFGLEPGEFGGTVQAWAALLHPEDRERSLKIFSDALADPAADSYSDEFRVIRPDSEVRWFQTIGRIFRGPDGAAQRAVGVNVDMTELIAARKTAEEATRAKSMFLATMSHEIRTPMNGVLGLLQLLGFSKLDAEQKATLDGASGSAKSLLRIIDDLLDFSKIEAGRLEIRPEATSVGAVIESVRQIYSGVASAKDLSPAPSVDPKISPALRIDPLRLRQILNNFASNAIKFTSKGSVEIAAALVKRADDRDVVRFSVTDTGIGVSKEAQARLFQPYAQATADTARQYGGTGLGLTICRRLADMMGGEITMRSEQGRGTIMMLTLTLPIADPKELKAGPSADATAAMVASRRSVPTVEAALKEGTLVLVAEDHPTNRNLVTRLLGLLGYAAETAEHGREALEKWGAGRYGLVLTDCNMPEMDGYELAHAIREREAGGKARIPIIACTANALAGEAERCIEAGMDDFVAKPIELEALAGAMQRWLPLPESGKRAAPKAAKPAVSAAAPIDLSSLATITGGDAAMEREILADFKAANDADMTTLRNALVERDLAKVTQASHRVKGACKMVGALALAGVCERMEKAGRRSSWPDVAVEQAALEQEFERLNRWLDAS